VGVITDTTTRAFERQTRRIAANRRLPWSRVRKRQMPDQREMAGLRQRLTRSVVEIEPKLSSVTNAVRELKAAAESGRDSLKVAYQGWLESLRELDRAYAAGWASLSHEVVALWQDAFLPRLVKLAGERRRLLPRPLKVALYFVLALIVLFVLYAALTGQLGQLIQFE
jgi:hypothetical protein